MAYQTAQTPEGKAETVAMLRGLKEKESLRLMAGMLGDRNEIVRRSACAAMADTPDPEGYFVKPLMGALADASTTVRVAASDALSKAALKADAIKALAFALVIVVGEQRQTNEKSDNAVILIKAYDSALEKLTGQKSKARDPRGLSSFWIDHWKQHEDALRAEDAQKVRADEPSRPANLPRDSFDGK
jgi:HEAT repeat protein